MPASLNKCTDTSVRTVLPRCVPDATQRHRRSRCAIDASENALTLLARASHRQMPHAFQKTGGKPLWKSRYCTVGAVSLACVALMKRYTTIHASIRRMRWQKRRDFIENWPRRRLSIASLSAVCSTPREGVVNADVALTAAVALSLAPLIRSQARGHQKT